MTYWDGQRDFLVQREGRPQNRKRSDSSRKEYPDDERTWQNTEGAAGNGTAEGAERAREPLKKIMLPRSQA